MLPKLAGSLRQVLDQRAELAVQVEKVVDAHPLADVLTSMPGVRVRTAARILLDVGDASASMRRCSFVGDRFCISGVGRAVILRVGVGCRPVCPAFPLGSLLVPVGAGGQGLATAGEGLNAAW